MSTYYKGYKVRLDPTPSQISLLKKHVDIARLVWNHFLEQQIWFYGFAHRFKSFPELSREFTDLRTSEDKKFSDLNQVSQRCGQKALKDLSEAIWKSVGKNKVKGRGFPRFKSKRVSKKHFNPGEQCGYWFQNSHFNCSKIGYIKLKEYNYIPTFNDNKDQQKGKYANPRISYDGLNWYLSIQIKCDSQAFNKNTTEELGIDVGINNLITLSNGQMYSYSKKLLSKCKRKQRYIRRLQQIISYKKLLMKKQIGNTNDCNKSKNLLHLEMLLRKAYQRDHNIRIDFIHKLTTSIIRRNPSKIVIEDLDITSMREGKTNRFNRRLAQSLIGEILRQLEYKAMWNEIPLVKAPRKYPSSKTCSNCGFKNYNFTTEKYYLCPKCGYHEHRDINAARNLVACQF